MKINRLNQSNYGFKSEKKEETKPTVEANEPKRENSPVNPEYYKSVNAIHFRGNGVLDGIKHTEQKKSMTVDGDTQTVKSYKKDKQEYLEIDDKVYRLRYSKNPEKNAQTVLSSKLYNLAGIETPEMKVIDNNGMYGYASEYTDKLSPIKYEPQKAYETYAVDAWLGNWNAYNDMNTAITEDGKVIKLVTSGSLQYRASGMKKESFDKNVTELDTLKDPQVNPNGSVIFQDMTVDDLINSLEKVVNIKKNDIILAVKQSQVSNQQEIIDVLLQRQETLREKLEELKVNKNEEIKPDPALDTVEEPETIEQTEPNKTVKSFPKRPYKKAYHPVADLDFIPQKDKDKANAKLDEYLAMDFSDDEDAKSLQWTFEYYSHNYPEMKDYIAYLKDKEYISKYNDKVYFSSRAFNNGSFPAIVKLATAQENYRHKNSQEDIVNLNNAYIPTGYLNEKVFVNGNEKITDILADYNNRQERYTSMLALAKEYDLKPEIEKNIVRSLQDEYCEIPAYKLDVFDYMMKVNKDLFLEPYNSYSQDGAKCLASDILRTCDSKEKADKFIDETLKEYQEMVPEFDRRSAHDIKELLNTKDKEFSKKKISTLRQMYFDECRYGGELERATQEDIDAINYLSSDIDINKIPRIMYSCRYYDGEYNDRNGKWHYDKGSMDFAKEYAVKLKEKGYENRANSLYEDTIKRYLYARENPERREAITDKFDRILDSGLLDIVMQDRKPLYKNSYWEEPTRKRGLTDDEVNCLIDMPEDKREFIISHLDIEGRNYQFSMENLIAYSELDDDIKQKIKDYRLENEPGWGFADIVLLGRETNETLELLKERNLLVPTTLTNTGYFTGTIEAYTNIELSKLSDEDWKKFNDRDLFNRQATVKYKTNKEEMSQRNLDISEAMILLNLSDKEFNEVVDSGMLEKYDIDAVMGKIEFSKFKDKDSISDFNINEKRELLNLFIKYNNNMFGDEFKSLNSDLHFLPKDSKEYCKKLQDISNSLGSNHKPISEHTKTNFYNTLNRIERPNSEFMRTDFDKPELKLDLEYSREDFIKNVSEKLSDLSQKDRQKVMSYYGFELKDQEGNLTMNGYPVNNYKSADMSDFSFSTAMGIETIKSDVIRFSEQNKIKPNGDISQSLADDLNNIIKVFPEFLTVVGKTNDAKHDLSIDVDTLATLQNVMKHPDYQKLSDEEKQILQISTLLKDLTKLEGHEDKTHPQFSAFDAYNIVEKLDLPREKRLQVYELIKNHEFLDEYRQNVSRDYAFNLRQGNSFLMETILVDAGLKSREDKEKLNKAKADITPLIDSIQKTGIILPQTKIPKANELKVNNTTVNDVETYNSQGKKIKNKVIKLEPNMNLKDIGFSEDIKSEDLNVLVHGLSVEEQSATLQVLGKPDSDALLSSSYVNYGKGNYHVFRQYGFVLDVASDDINAAYYRDFGSGYGKSLNNLKSDYLFDGYRKEMRNYISDKIKQELNLSDEEYKELYPKISNKSITELDEEFPEVAAAYRNIINSMEEGKRSHGREYNEMLVSRPQIQGIFYQGTKDGSEFKIEDVPEFLREYAEEHNVPIIYFGK